MQFFEPFAYLSILNRGAGRNSNALLDPWNILAKCCDQNIGILFLCFAWHVERLDMTIAETLRPKLNVSII